MFFQLEGLPPSTNQSLLVANGRLIHSPKARTYRQETEEAVQRQLDQLLRLFPSTSKELKDLEGEPLFAQIKYYSTWTTKANKCRKKDVCNLEKLLLDSIFSILKKNGFALDDSQIYLCLLAKHDAVDGNEKTEVQINTQSKFRF